ncbi:bifunctional DNA primase/polymerase [Streptomyces yaizuensis]|uniref:Bifunctional DNA primase/polymerase n=1 Tax=Streptomyces yaizuensis TaxID=2989713 RepID=A0ABQ5NTS7_9ACTN|nr:bifunctional DNA primase/polymerase [Streptomyces sp. YSPA8]GLF93548.1 bifunctional DNA primase/polymerase [Streptomyces sp. YSPA8]
MSAPRSTSTRPPAADGPRGTAGGRGPGDPGRESGRDPGRGSGRAVRTAAPQAAATRATATRATAAGVQWLASAGTSPRALLALWEAEPTAPAVLPCGSAFDVVSVVAVFGRQMLDRLRGEGPGSGPVAAHRGRALIFAAPGTAARLPALLEWEEWGDSVPPLLCHGTGDAITVPPVAPGDGRAPGSRWLVAPDSRHPWLPGPEVLLWACVRAARTAAAPDVRGSIFLPGDQGANLYDVSRRR